MLKILLLSLSRQYTVDGQYIPSLFIEPDVRHDKPSYKGFKLSSHVESLMYSGILRNLRISSDKASNLPKRDVRFILLK